MVSPVSIWIELSTSHSTLLRIQERVEPELNVPVHRSAANNNDSGTCKGLSYVRTILFVQALYAISASLIPPITTAAAPAAPKIGFPTVNPTIAPATPRQIATFKRALRAELLPAPSVTNWYPHDGQLKAVSEIDLLHSGHAIEPIPVFLSLPNACRNRVRAEDTDLRYRVKECSDSRDSYPSFAGRYFPNWFNNSRNSFTNSICAFVVFIGSRKVTTRWHFFRLSFG